MKRNGKRIAIAAGVLALAVLGLAAWLSWPHLRFWWLFEPLGTNAQGYSEYRHRKTGIVFVSLPGGKFWMGAQKDDPNGPNYDPEAAAYWGPLREVKLSPFLVGKYEVTKGEWKRVMGKNPSPFQGPNVPAGVNSDHLPVEVSWEDCQEFCRKTGLKLPSEAQWEYACRAGTTRPYTGTAKLEDIAWFDENSGDQPHLVGQKQPNQFGLHDMQGNVWEWCEDAWGETFYSRPEAAREVPVRTASPEAAGEVLVLTASPSWERVLRGGAFYDRLDILRCAGRRRANMSERSRDIGCRVVASPFSDP